MAANKFKPKTSGNTIEGVTEVTETQVQTNSEEINVETPVAEIEVDKTPETAPVEVTDSGENPETAPPDVQFEDNSDKKAPERKVKIVLKENHTCSIGGVRYHFEKGKQYNVPASVKSILMQAGLLMPL